MRLNKIYKQIPTFTCAQGCNECCGPTPVNFIEAGRIGIEGPTTPVVAEELGNLTCKFSTPNGCSIYDKRPFMCRLFGTINSLQCPKNCKPEKMLSPKEENRLLKYYMNCE